MGRVKERSKIESEREIKGSEESATDFDDLHRQREFTSGERRRKELRVDLMTSVTEEVAGGNVGR